MIFLRYVFTIAFALTIALYTNTVNAANAEPTEPKIIELNKQNLITLRGEIDEQLTSEIIRKINKFSNNQVYLYITSPGGSVIEGLQIIDQLQTLAHRNIKLSCIADFAASMAFIIFQSCPNRYVTTSSVLMQHQMSLKLKGNIENINTYLEFIKDIDTDLDELQSNKLKMPIEEFKKKINNDWWMNYKSIIKSNAADSLAVVVCVSELVDMSEDVVKSSLLFDVKAKFSKCPISREPTEIKYNSKFGSVTLSETLINDITKKIIPSQFIKELATKTLISTNKN
jgi:ATP-dependent Clp protease, protease subunit